MLSVPTIDASTNRSEAALTPSIHTVFQQIPDKKVEHFAEGSYIVKEGDPLPGFYLIKVRPVMCRR